jgi:hypothetical protein
MIIRRLLLWGLLIGPPSTVCYPYHGIYISLNFTFTSFVLHIPEGMTVQLNDNTIKVTGVSAAGPVERTVHFSTASYIKKDAL